ncbi:MAG: hypothetical protein JW774_09280, partial [Candidatus Aureabacteria bacterium]|nr:hypothetical protein [Candidatus Auribacterota bacterium]
RQNGNQFQQIQYVTRDVHEINTLAGEGYPLPQFIFVFDALHNFLDAGEAVRKMGEILDDKKGGILAANYPANVLDQTDPAFKGFFRFIGNVETNFLLASQIPKLARPKEKRFRNELVSRMVRGLDGRFDIRIGKTNITQTIRQILTMMSEERDYLERLFAYTPDETVPEAYRTLLRRIQHLKTENSFMKDWKGDPMEFPVTRVWNVLQIQRKGELEYPSGDPTDSAV